MRLLFGKTIDRRIAEYQKELIAKHCDEVQNIYQTMRGWRHDYHNHIQTLLALSGNEAKTREYLLKLNDDLTQVDTVLKTGNVMVDAILNSKLSLIRSKEIRVNAKAVVPTELNVSEIDLCVIIGNLLGLLLLGGMVISIGMLISSLTESQFIAALGTFVVSFALLMIDNLKYLFNASWLATIVDFLSINQRYNDFTIGVIHYDDILFFLSMQVLFLFLTVRVLDRKRWS